MAQTASQTKVFGFLLGLSILCLVFSMMNTVSNLHQPDIDGAYYSFQPMLDVRLVGEGDSNDSDDANNNNNQEGDEINNTIKKDEDNNKSWEHDQKLDQKEVVTNNHDGFWPRIRRSRRHGRPVHAKRYSSLKEVPLKTITNTQTRNQRLGQKKDGGKTFFLVHIHKSAGTSMCRMAYQNRLHTRFRENCNVQKDQRCCGNIDTIEAQEEFARITRYDFVAIEKEMYESMAPNYYHYIVILRNSFNRYYSHWLHTARAHSLVTVGSFSQWWVGQPDNWNTRVLCGPSCLDSNKYALTYDMFQHTLDRLRLFEDILFVEDIENSYRKFTKKHKWSTTPIQEHNAAKDAKVQLEKKELDAAFVGDQYWDPLMSALDDALYEFAQRKESGLEPFDNFTSSVQLQLDHYFKTGLSRNCTTICCGNECSIYR